MTEMIAFIHLALAWYCASTASASSSVVALVKLVHSGSGGASIVRGVVIVCDLAEARRLSSRLLLRFAQNRPPVAAPWPLNYRIQRYGSAVDRYYIEYQWHYQDTLSQTTRIVLQKSRDRTGFGTRGRGPITPDVTRGLQNGVLVCSPKAPRGKKPRPRSLM